MRADYSRDITVSKFFKISGTELRMIRLCSRHVMQESSAFYQVFVKTEAFGKPDLPFYIVELASYEHSERETAQTSTWVQIQDTQREVCSRMHNVFLIPNRDQGEWNDIHPQNKKTLGERVVKAILENGF